MAIDTSLFMADIPAGTYAVGDKLQLTIKAGPAVVRSGRGAAILKRMTAGILHATSGGASNWKVTVKNSDWVDEMASLTAPLWGNLTMLDERSGCIQRGDDCPLTPNSAWTVEAECIAAVTTTVPNSVFALIDIDYPSVSSIVDPDVLPGIPATIDYSAPSAITIHAAGSSAGASWAVFNTDFFKAGFEYALQKVEMLASTACEGFIALTNAAGMAGLTRIIPVNADPLTIRNKNEYATKLVKGPLDVQYMLFATNGTATTGTPRILMDFVKRRQ